ncbi:MAG: IMP dehydrogenase [Armatimonadetes bacterium]|jgi:IMP dehydrogenase|nr:IMP dehydrogenase [Armatimonadota bacterium]MDI9603610.1 IMP dehydrogenase [Acidobacteriota bacterium]NLN91077.1 IMP dehydrogenase [candidate division WS1 bacterium]
MPRDLPLALSFEDITMVPARSSVVPKEVDVTTRLTPKITLNIPIISAAMDTVTESRLATALAREGGLGVIHKGMSIQRQAEEVDAVKRSESGMITKPITLGPDRPVSDAMDLMARYRISGVPITAPDRTLVGILTNRDLRFEVDRDRLISEVMTTKGLVTTTEGTTLQEAQAVLHEHRIEKLPVVDDNGRLIGLITIKDIEKTRKYPNACKDELGRLRVGAAVGVAADLFDRARALVDAGVDVLVLDSSHGHSEGVLRAARQLRERFPETQIIGGNVVTAEGCRDLIEAGVDAVKVGVGPGSICTTRIVTGAGVPQVSAILETAEAAAATGTPIVADGGIKYSGDIAKALACGASALMIGSLFAGTEEAPGETILYEGRTYKEYRGMGSIGAMKASSSDRYFQDHIESESKLVPEGIEGRVPYKGPLPNLVYQLIGGLRSGMGLVGAPDIPHLQKHTRIVQVTVSGLRESHVHDVAITREAPNYQR